MSKLLTVGDIIELIPGHKIYVNIPDHFIYQNRKNVFNKSSETDITIGENKNGLDTNYFAGRYVVTETSQEGGGYGHGIHDFYPDGHRVFCELLDWQKQYNEPLLVNFYQTGCFTAMIEDIHPIGKAIKNISWSIIP